MKCPEYRDWIIPLIKGHLPPTESEQLRSHLDGCENCRREYEESAWIAAGFLASASEIRGGHISAKLLYQFVQTPGSLESETIDFVRSHLERCDQCQRDSVGIKQLLEIDVDGGTDAKEAERSPTHSWWRFFRGRLVPAYAALAIILIAAAVFVVTSVDETSPLIARAVTQADAARSGYTMIALANYITTRGTDESAESKPTTIVGVNRKPVVVSLEAVTFEDEELSWRVVIAKGDGLTVWESDLDTAHLESGQIWLILDWEKLEPGVYQLSVLEQDGEYTATISTARFEIVD